MTITAVIPVRAGSKRLPNKNILPFGDSNLLIHKIRQLKNVKEIDNIVVSSDSNIMLEMAKEEGVSIHKRSLEYCDEKTRTFNEVVENIAKSIDGDILMWTPCVCPLTNEKNYEKAIEKFYNLVIEKGEYDSIISAREIKMYLYGENGPINWDPGHHVPSQLLPDIKTIINGFYIAKTEQVIEWKYLYGENPYCFMLSNVEAIDIDNEIDYEFAKFMYDKYGYGKTDFSNKFEQ